MKAAAGAAVLVIAVAVGITPHLASAVLAADEAPAIAPAPSAAPSEIVGKAGEKPVIAISILYLKQLRDENPPLSLLDLAPDDEGIAGARLAVADNNTTGTFLGQSFKLETVESANVDDLIKGANDYIAAGTGFVIADLDSPSLIKLADALAGKPALVLNVGNPDDELREEKCRANVVHLAPTRTMLADALGQYLVWKQWRNWFIVSGPTAQDKLLADAYKRAAKRFGGKIVEEREFKYESGSRRADGGFEQIQQQIPQFTQNAKDHDVVIVADEGQLFADYMPYRTWTPRPVAGSAGLTPTSWHPALELWGGTQFQNRFKRMAGRLMRPLDYNAWIAMRVVGEAAARKQTGDFRTLNDYIHSPEFEVAAFKGVKTTFRGWNGQLRQPLIVTTPKLLVTISPQPGFLHQFTELDTLGIDKPETKCQAYTKP
ncbi:MAG: ABC transporter substrate-binding protein [Hyphomicrobium sp.]|nr:ABC transporter substrate-binding protein [Hyphomicrobium sp.]